MPSPPINVGRPRRPTPLASPDPRGEAFAHPQLARPIAFPRSATQRVVQAREDFRKKFSAPKCVGNLLDSASAPPSISRSGTRIAQADMSIAVGIHADA